MITVSVVVLIVVVVIKFKCFKHKMGAFCFKEDLEYKNGEELDGFPTQSLNKDKYIIGNDYTNNGNILYRLIIFLSVPFSIIGL